jgi:hypothetical protein
MGIMDASIKWEKSAENAVKFPSYSVTDYVSSSKVSFKLKKKKKKELCIRNKHRRYYSEKNEYLNSEVDFLKSLFFVLLFQKCKICRKKGDDSALLLCDECNQAFHMHCLRPALFQIPKGDWLCPACDVCLIFFL